MLRQCKDRLQFHKKENPLSIDNELKKIFHVLEKLLNENHLFQNRFNYLDIRYQQWICDERIYLLKRIEKLENENQLYRTYQIQNEKSIRSITHLILQILSTQQDLRKQSIVRHNVNDSAQWRKKRQQDEPIPHSRSCHLDDSQHTITDQSIWFHEVKEHDQKTRNYSAEPLNHSSTLATGKSKSEKPPPPAALSNKLYYVLNNEKTVLPSSSSKSRGIPITPVDDGNTIPNCKQQSSLTFKKNQSQTRSTTYSNHERLPIQTSLTGKNTSTKITIKPRTPTITIRPPITVRPSPPTNRKTVSVSATASKPSPPRYAAPKQPTRPANTAVRPRFGGQTSTTKSNISPTKNIKTRVPIVPQQSARVTDLDALIAEQQKQKTVKSTIITPSILVQQTLFSKDTVKHVRPVRSQELKLFSCHLTPDIPFPTNESLATLTASSYESIHDNLLIKQQTTDFNSSSNISSVIRDFSEDSLNEHYHIQKLLQQNATSIEQGNNQMDIKQGYFLSASDDFNAPYAPPSSVIQAKPISSFVHRLVFPERLGRLIFSRKTLSDSDIYQKICSKDQEILHNVYHLDTIRDYSMEFYMLTTYASDSQLRAWLEDEDDDEIQGHFNENRFLSSDGDINQNTRRTIHSDDNLIQEEELDWCSELQLLTTKENSSNQMHTGELLSNHQTSSDFWTVPIGGFNQLHSTPIPSNLIDSSNLLLGDILNHSWPDQLSTSNSIEQETGIEQFENDSTSSIITDEFQRDFYYLCPISTTTSFPRTDSKT